MERSSNYGPGLQLYYSYTVQAWAFGRSADIAGRPLASRLRHQTPSTGQWTHLVGVYDAPAQERRLHVNGKLTGTQAWTSTPPGTPPAPPDRPQRQQRLPRLRQRLDQQRPPLPHRPAPADASAIGDTPRPSNSTEARSHLPQARPGRAPGTGPTHGAVRGPAGPRPRQTAGEGAGAGVRRLTCRVTTNAEQADPLP
ncbi:LamG-like jellyroll fold domain-containing protein [Streptomyces sp. NPDC059373]